MPNWKKIIVSGSDASLSSLYIDGNLTASAAFLTSASIGHLETIYETASVIYSSGSTKFGDTSDDTHEFTGSIQQSGSDSSFIGNVGIGNPSPRAKLDIFGEAADDTIVYMTQIDSSNDAPNFRAEKARGTDASKQDVVNDDGLFSLNTWAYYNGAYRNSGQFRFEVDGTPAGTNVPVVFALRTDDGSGLADRIRVNGDGTIDLLGPVTGSSITGSFTGSLEGSASYAVTASHVAGGFTNSGSFSGSFEGDGSGLTGISVTQAATITDTFTAQTSVTVSHNFTTENVLVTAYTDNGEQLIPQTVRTLDDNNVGVDFATSTTGRIVVAKGGHIVSGSVLTASLALELSNLATASIADTATTASHTAGTASISNLATTASIADLASTLSNTATASFADTATTASHVVTASFADNATSSSFAETASYALNAAAGGGGVGYSNAITLSTDYTATANTYNSLYGPLAVSNSINFEIEAGAIVKIEEF